MSCCSRAHRPAVRARCARFALAGLLIMLLAACATVQTDALRTSPPADLPARTELQTVPYFAQDAHQCGPASLAMAMQAVGQRVTPEQLEPEVYLPAREGSLQIEMLAATRRHGLIAYELPPQLNDLLREVAAGNAPVVLQNLAFNWYPVWHYAVVIGYDLDRGTIILRSGPEARQELPLTTFEHTWQRGGYWAMLALPPRRLPRSVEQDRYVAAALALEQTGEASVARIAYGTALTLWPDNLTARIGAGNTAYAADDFIAAEQAFRAATRAHPDSSIAFNNLADTLARQKRYTEALTAAEEAVRLGGAQQATFAQTLAQIKAKIKASPAKATTKDKERAKAKENTNDKQKKGKENKTKIKSADTQVGARR